MIKAVKISLVLAALWASGNVTAGEINKMIGTWKWESFVIKVDNCEATEVCAVVVSGPKNVGLQMIKSKLKPVDNGFVGVIAHPQTGDDYHSKIKMASANTWHIDGCTKANVCASGDFSRVK